MVFAMPFEGSWSVGSLTIAIDSWADIVILALLAISISGLVVVAARALRRRRSGRSRAGAASAQAVEFSDSGLPLAGELSDGMKVFTNKSVKTALPERITFADRCYIDVGGNMKLCGKGRVELLYPNGGVVALNKAKVNGNGRIIINGS